MSILNQLTNGTAPQPATENQKSWSGLGALTQLPDQSAQFPGAHPPAPNLPSVPQGGVQQPDIFGNNLGPGIPPEARQHIDTLHQQLLAHHNNVDETGYHTPTPFGNFMHTLGNIAHFIPGLNLLTDPMMQATANKNISDNRMDWATYEQKNKEYLDAKAKADVALKNGEQPNVVPDKPKKPLTMEQYLSKSDLLNYVKTNFPGASRTMANENINKAVMDNQPHVAYRMALDAGYDPKQAHQLITQGISNRALSQMSDKLPELIANNDGKGINALLAKNIKNLNSEDIGKVALLYKQTAESVKETNKALADRMLATARMLKLRSYDTRTKQMGIDNAATNATRIDSANIAAAGKRQAAAIRAGNKTGQSAADILDKDSKDPAGNVSPTATAIRVLGLPGGLQVLREAGMMPKRLDKPPVGVAPSPTGYYIKGKNGSIEPLNQRMLDLIDKKIDEEGPQQQSAPPQDQTTDVAPNNNNNDGWNGSGDQNITPEEVKNNPNILSVNVPIQNILKAAVDSGWGSQSVQVLQQAARDGITFVHWGTGMYARVQGTLIPIKSFISMAIAHKGSK